jgi:outer membrane protein assembly factor BamB
VSSGAVGDGTGGGDAGPSRTLKGSFGAPKVPAVESGVPAPSEASNWTMLGYDPQSTYWNRGETKITKKTVASLDAAWVFDLPAGSTSSTEGVSPTGTPVIADGRVYVASSGVTTLDLATGDVIWRASEYHVTSSPALSDGVLYVHDTMGVVRAFRAEDGTELWKYQTSPLSVTCGYSSPKVTSDLVIVGGSSTDELSANAPEFRGFVLALHKRDGTLAWQKFTVDGAERGATVWSTVSIDEHLGVVYTGTGNNYGPPASSTSDAYLAMPLETGESFIWVQQMVAGDTWMINSPDPDEDFGANPVVYDVEGRRLVAGGNKGGDFWILDRETGAIIQKRNLGPGSAFKGGIFQAVAWDGQRLLTVCNGATSTEPGSEDASAQDTAVLYALDPLSLDINWARQIRGPVYGPIAVANGVGFFGKGATLQAFDTETGEVLKEVTTEATIASAPAISNGYVVFGSGMTWVQATQGTKYHALKVN